MVDAIDFTWLSAQLVTFGSGCLDMSTGFVYLSKCLDISNVILVWHNSSDHFWFLIYCVYVPLLSLHASIYFAVYLLCYDVYTEKDVHAYRHVVCPICYILLLTVVCFILKYKSVRFLYDYSLMGTGYILSLTFTRMSCCIMSICLSFAVFMHMFNVFTVLLHILIFCIVWIIWLCYV